MRAGRRAGWRARRGAGWRQPVRRQQRPLLDSVDLHLHRRRRRHRELEADLEEKELDKARAEGELEQSSRALGALNDLMYDMRQNQAELEDQLEATGAALQLSSDQKEQAQARLAEQEREISTLKAEHAELKRASKLLMMQTLNDVQARMK